MNYAIIQSALKHLLLMCIPHAKYLMFKLVLLLVSVTYIYNYVTSNESDWFRSVEKHSSSAVVVVNAIYRMPQLMFYLSCL